VAAQLTGTLNQVTVSNGAGVITLSTPQNINTAATPTFASETLSATSNQITMGIVNTATISATTPTASRTYTIADPGASANFVMDTGGALTITNTPSAGQVLTYASSTTASWAAPAASTSLTHVEVSSTTAITGFSTAAFTLVTGMTSTPAAGTYWVSFSTVTSQTSSFAIFNVAIFNGVTQVTISNRQLTGENNANRAMQTQAIVVATGSAAITIQWQKAFGPGTATMNERSMFLLRVA